MGVRLPHNQSSGGISGTGERREQAAGDTSGSLLGASWRSDPGSFCRVASSRHDV